VLLHMVLSSFLTFASVEATWEVVTIAVVVVRRRRCTLHKAFAVVNAIA
jgi:hypothetical protein